MFALVAIHFEYSVNMVFHIHVFCSNVYVVLFQNNGKMFFFLHFSALELIEAQFLMTLLWLPPSPHSAPLPSHISLLLSM